MVMVVVMPSRGRLTNLLLLGLATINSIRVVEADVTDASNVRTPRLGGGAYLRNNKHNIEHQVAASVTTRGNQQNYVEEVNNRAASQICKLQVDVECFMRSNKMIRSSRVPCKLWSMMNNNANNDMQDVDIAYSVTNLSPTPVYLSQTTIRSDFRPNENVTVFHQGDRDDDPTSSSSSFVLLDHYETKVVHEERGSLSIVDATTTDKSHHLSFTATVHGQVVSMIGSSESTTSPSSLHWEACPVHYGSLQM